jgi:hypothetical protein
MSNRKFPKIGVDTQASIAIEAIGEKKREIRQLRAQLAHANERVATLRQRLNVYREHGLTNQGANELRGKLQAVTAALEYCYKLAGKISAFDTEANLRTAMMIRGRVEATLENKVARAAIDAARGDDSSPCCGEWEALPLYGIKTGDAEADRPVSLKCDGCAGDDSNG